MENEVVEEVVGAELQKTYKLSLRAADVYFEIYLATGSRRMTHDLVELIYHLVAVLPKQLTLSLVKAPRLLYARGFNQLQIKTVVTMLIVRLKRDYYSLPRWSHTPPTQFGARYQQFRFNDARGEARLQHITTHEQDEAGFWITFLNKGTPHEEFP